MASFTCPKCKRKFASERGLKIHQGRGAAKNSGSSKTEKPPKRKSRKNKNLMEAKIYRPPRVPASSEGFSKVREREVSMDVLGAIKLKCEECNGWQDLEEGISKCTSTHCPLWAFRLIAQEKGIVKIK